MVSLQLTGISLREVSDLIDSLDAEPAVAKVEIFTANTGSENGVTGGIQSAGSRNEEQDGGDDDSEGEDSVTEDKGSAATIMMTIVLQEVSEE